MAVTTRNYTITQATPINVVGALRQALSDLGWMAGENIGYLQTFTNTPGGLVASEKNNRYLVAPASTPNANANTGIGANIVFDVVRNGYGAVATVTLVAGGDNTLITGLPANSVGNVLTVGNTAGLYAGQLVLKTSGTGTLVANTVISSVPNSTSIIVNPAPSLALSTANVQVYDVITISGESIGGNSNYNVTNVTATSGSNLLTVPTNANITIGQRAYGTNLANFSTVTNIQNNIVTLSAVTVGAVSGNVTFSDEITVFPGTIANWTGISGNAANNQIHNVLCANNIAVGANLTILTGSATVSENVYISAISGSGPYVLTVQNQTQNFKGFNGAINTAITFKVSNGNVNDWFCYDTYTAPLTAAWGVAKIVNSSTAKLGTSFWTYLVSQTSAAHQPLSGGYVTLNVRASPGFNPNTKSTLGASVYDWVSSALGNNTGGAQMSINIASTPFIPVTLNVRQSTLDPNFAVFTFVEKNTVRSPFFISYYNNNIQPWTLNDYFLGGVYEVFQNPSYNSSDVALTFRTRINGMPKRQGESGYGNYNQAASVLSTTVFRSQSGNRTLGTPSASYGDVSLYSRQINDVHTSAGNTFPVFNTLPINPYFLPVPYYLPNDFVIVEVPWGNVAIGDTITVSGSEIYTVLQVATNQTTFVSLAFCARTT